MFSKLQFISLTLLICILFSFCGCKSLGSGDAKLPKEVERTEAEKDKARLLRRIDRNFDNADLHFQLGRLYQADGLWAKAESEYNLALGFDPVHRRAQAGRIKGVMDSGNQAKAEMLTEIYMDQAVNSAGGSLRLALAFQEQGLDEDAMSCYRQALRLAPNSAKINRQIGYYYLTRGDKVQAQEYLTRSFQLNPNQADVAGELGLLGIEVKVPRKTRKTTKRLEKIVDEKDKELMQ